MIYDVLEGEYAEKVAFTFIKAMKDKNIKPEISMTASIIAFIKICKAKQMEPKQFNNLCDSLKDAYLDALIDD